MPIVEVSSWAASNAYLADPTILQSVGEVATKTDGCLGLYSGIAEEDGKRVYNFIVWETLEHHKALAGHPSFPEILKTIKSTQDGEGKMCHVEFNNDFIPALTAPTTEILGLTLQEGKTKEDLYSILNAIAAKINAGNAKYAPVTWGQTLEDPKKFYLTIGWDSTKAHIDFVGEASFQPLLADLKNAAILEMFHSSLSKGG